MKRVTSLVCSLIVGAFMCAGVLAHDPRPKSNYALLGLNEILELVFLANCNGPPDDDDASIVPVDERRVRFKLLGEGRSGSEGTAFAWSFLEFDVSHGEAIKVELPADTYGQLQDFRIQYVSGHGVCKVDVVGRITNANGETVGSPVKYGWDIATNTKL